MPIVFSTQLVFPPSPPKTLSIVTSNPLPQATVGTAYNEPILATGGVPPYTWQILNWTQYTVSISSTTTSVSGATASLTTPSVTASGSGGALPYIYSWGSTGLANASVDSPTSGTTTFTCTNLTPGQTVNFTCICTITDSLGRAQTVSCAVSVSRVSLVTGQANPTSLSTQGTGSTQTTAATTITAGGGQTPYTYQWIFQAGASPQLSITAPTSATTQVTGTGMTSGNSYSGTLLCTLTDFYNQTDQITVPVNITDTP